MVPGCELLCPLRRAGAPAGGHLCREAHVPPAASLPGRVARRPYNTTGTQIHNKVMYGSTWGPMLSQGAVHPRQLHSVCPQVAQSSTAPALPAAKSPPSNGAEEICVQVLR